MHDGFALSFSVAELEDKIDRFISSSTREEAKQLFGTLCNPQQWDYTEARKILASGRWRWKISRIWVAPFDLRYTVYDRAVAVHLRRRLCGHFFKRQNIGLVIGGAGQEITGDEWDAVCCVDDILQLNYFRRNGSPTLPLYLYGDNLLVQRRRRSKSLVIAGLDPAIHPEARNWRLGGCRAETRQGPTQGLFRLNRCTSGHVGR